MIGSEKKYCEQVYTYKFIHIPKADFLLCETNFKFNAKTHQNNSQPCI